MGYASIGPIHKGREAGIEMTTSTRTRKRQNWRASWPQYTRANAAKRNRPDSNRRTRRNYWREAWAGRDPGEYDNKDDSLV